MPSPCPNSGHETCYRQLPFDAFKRRLAGLGMIGSFAPDCVDMMTAGNEGVDDTASRATGNITPTSFRRRCEPVLRPALDGLADRTAVLRTVARRERRA